MKYMHTIFCCLACIVLLLSAGCADTSFGTLKPTDFGSSAEEMKALDYYKQIYGEPGQPGEPRFLEPTITTALDSRNMPVDSITSLSTAAPKVYFWVFYDRFVKGDPMTITWTYLDNNKVVLTETRQAGGVYGRVFAEFVKPAGNWPVGKHQITIVGKGTTASKTFDVIGGQTVTGAQPFTEGAANSGSKSGGSSSSWNLETNKKGAVAVVQGVAPPPLSCTCTQNRVCGNFDGTWHHADNNMLEGSMVICQEGSSATAIYYLSQTLGRISGTISGNRLTGTWTEYESDGVTIADTGRVIMVLSPGNNAWSAWYTYSNSLPDTTGPAQWIGTKTGTCPSCGAGEPTRTIQTMTTPVFQTAVTTPTQTFATAKTTTPIPWQTAVTAITTTPTGGSCGGHCNDPNRQCGLWDARWHHRNWGDNLEGTMTLCQNGNTMTGTYNIAQTTGRITGTTSGVSGTELRGTWTEYETDGVTVQGTGAFVYRLKSGNSAWDGWFNYNPGSSVDTSGAATWTGTKL